MAIDLIDKLLIYAPEKRLKACEALAHPFFDDLRKDNFKIENKKINLNLFDFSLGIFFLFFFKLKKIPNFQIIFFFFHKNFNLEELGGSVALKNKLVPLWSKQK